MKSFPIAVVATLVLAACGGKPTPVAATDSLTPTPVADVPPAPTRVETLFVAPSPVPVARRAPRPIPAPLPAPRRGDNGRDNRGDRGDRGDRGRTETPAPSRGGSLEAGTEIRTTLVDSIHSAYSGPGDPIRATVTADVSDGGRTVIPAGSVVIFRIGAIGPATSRGERGTLDISAESVQINGRNYRIRGNATDYDFTMKARNVNAGDVVTAAGGAGIGALIGHVIGGKTGTIVGAIGGAAAGTAVAAKNADRDIIVHAGTPVTVVLTEPFDRN
jgi:hypothetical protein